MRSDSLKNTRSQAPEPGWTQQALQRPSAALLHSFGLPSHAMYAFRNHLFGKTLAAMGRFSKHAHKEKMYCSGESQARETMLCARAG